MARRGTGRGMAGRGKAGQGKARHGAARQGKASARRGPAEQGKAGRGRARRGMARRGKARGGKAMVGRGRARQGTARRGKARIFMLVNQGNLEFKSQCSTKSADPAAVKINRPTDIINRKRRTWFWNNPTNVRPVIPATTRQSQSRTRNPHFEPGALRSYWTADAQHYFVLVGGQHQFLRRSGCEISVKLKDLANAMLSFVSSIRETWVPLDARSKPIVVPQLEHDRDPLSGTYVHYSVARLDKGIPNPKVRGRS